MEKILVTGGGGFIGSHLVHALLKTGYAVRVLDNFATGRRENLAGVLDAIELIDHPEGFASPEVCRRAVEGITHILHQGALASVPRSVENPSETDRVNVGGTLNLLEAAREAGVRRFVFASSCSVYGNSTGQPRREDDKTEPISPYAVSKLAAEAYVLLYHRLHGMETVALRYFNVFGPRQDPTSRYAAVVPIFTSRLLGGQAPTIYGDGEQMRDFIYVDNVVTGNLLALQANGVKGEIFNLAAGRTHSVNELFLRLREIIGAEEIEPAHAPPRAGDVRRSQAEVSKAKRLLGYRVSVSFEEGLRRTVAWHRENRPASSRYEKGGGTRLRRGRVKDSGFSPRRR